MKARVLRILCWLMLAACVGASFMRYLDMRRAWNAWVSPIEEKSAADVALAAETLPGLDWAAFSQSDRQTLGADGNPERSTQAPEMRFIGNPGVIAHFPLSAGRLPMAEEPGVCALDRATAFNLWNSDDVTGKRLVINKASYTVVGVLDIDPGLVLLPSRKNDKMDRLAVYSPDGYEALASLSGALGVTLETWFLGDRELEGWLLPLCALPVLLLIAGLLIRLYRRGGLIGIAGKALLWCAAIAALCWVVACVPSRLLPGNWSDFPFYVEQVNSWQNRTLRLPSARDLMIQSDALRLMMTSALACLTLIAERMCRKCAK
jgi:hypothetical protein